MAANRQKESIVHKSALLTITTCCVLTQTGCGPGMVVKRFISEAKGASSEATIVPGTVNSRFNTYRGVHIEVPRTQLGRLVTTDFMAALREHLRERLVKEDDAPFPGGEPHLTLQPRVMWYDGEGGGLLGSDAYAVVLFELLDGENMLGKVQVVTKSAASRTDDAAMAKSMAKELAEWFEDRAE